MALMIRPDGTKVGVRPRHRKFTRKEMCRRIGNGCELIQVIGPSENGVFLIVDEEGKIRVNRVNILATICARNIYRLPDYDHIVGNALLVPSEEMFD